MIQRNNGFVLKFKIDIYIDKQYISYIDKSDIFFSLKPLKRTSFQQTL